MLQTWEASEVSTLASSLLIYLADHVLPAEGEQTTGAVAVANLAIDSTQYIRVACCLDKCRAGARAILALEQLRSANELILSSCRRARGIKASQCRKVAPSGAEFETVCLYRLRKQADQRLRSPLLQIAALRTISPKATPIGSDLRRTDRHPGSEVPHTSLKHLISVFSAAVYKAGRTSHCRRPQASSTVTPRSCPEACTAGPGLLMSQSRK